MSTLLRLFPVLLMMALAGCSASTSIKAEKSANYDAQPKSLIVIYSLGAAFAKPLLGSTDPADYFQNHFAESFATCGITTKMVAANPSSPTDQIAGALKSFPADAILSIQWKKQLTGGMGVVSVDYYLELLDVKDKHVVWKAMLTLGNVQNTFFEERGNALVRQIQNELVTDKIAPANCFVPEKPPTR